jgi:tRNA 5-methylaminomethyl-2-thiouridine biosynthesis bifunctional protein
VGRFDAFFLDGFAPAVNPALWEARVLKSLGRLAAPGATAATWSAARAVRDGLRTAGFTVKSAAGFGRKREMTQAQFTPRVPTTPPPGRPAGPWPGERRAVVIGAGLAGAAVAQALARQGWHCQVLDARARPAEGASGNPAGLFHGVVHRGEGTYQRLHRAAALLAHAHYAPLVREGRVSGATDGLIVQGRGEAIDGYAQALSDEEARSRSGAAQCGQALHLPQAGWVDPAGLVAHWLATPGVDFRGGVTVSHIEPAATLGANGIVRDAAGTTLAQAPLIVLASGSGLPRWSHDGLLDVPGLHTTRGQLTWFDHPPCLRLPLSGHGYAVQLPDGRLMCGATSQAEEDPAWALPGKLGSRVTAGTPTGIRHQVDPLRDEDHAWNLERLQALTGISPAQSVPRGGRAQWRLNTLDRLPLIGPLPAPLQLGERGDQARLMRRIPGVFVAGAFGSRGLSWAPLAGELIAGWAEGTPLPLEADLLDAIDPARWPVRRHRRSPTRGS